MIKQCLGDAPSAWMKDLCLAVANVSNSIAFMVYGFSRKDESGLTLSMNESQGKTTDGLMNQKLGSCPVQCPIGVSTNRSSDFTFWVILDVKRTASSNMFDIPRLSCLPCPCLCNTSTNDLIFQNVSGQLQTLAKWPVSCLSRIPVPYENDWEPLKYELRCVKVLQWSKWLNEVCL